MDFMDMFSEDNKETIVVKGKRLLQGDIVNIYGEDYVGKTTECYNIIENNKEYSVMYFDTENSLYPKLEKMAEEIDVLYSNESNINNMLKMIDDTTEAIDYYIIDSITAVNENNVMRLMELFNLIKKNKKNLILVSQVRSINEKISYDYEKLINYYAYKFEKL
jgi:predicted ATP-dependent serine protease